MWPGSPGYGKEKSSKSSRSWQRQGELGVPQAQDGDTHPRQVVATALGYLQNHKDKMAMRTIVGKVCRSRPAMWNRP